MNNRHRILIADDDRDSQSLYRIYLKSSPYQVVFADNGLEAFEKYKEAAFDLVILDIQMPVLDGFGALNEIRNFEKNSNHNKAVPILGISAHNLSDLPKGTGFTDYLVKPITAAKLKKAITDILHSQELNSKSAAEMLQKKMLSIAPQYLQKRKQELSELRKLLESGHIDDIEKISHKIKGSAASYGFEMLGKLNAELNAAAKISDLAEITRLISEIENHLTKS